METDFSRDISFSDNDLLSPGAKNTMKILDEFTIT